MKLSLAKTEDRAPSYDEESNIFQPLALQIVTPGGTTITMQVTTGDTISIIKKRYCSPVLVRHRRCGHMAQLLLQLAACGECVLNVSVCVDVARLEVEHSISYKETVLTLNDKVMIEPLSLNDFADLPAVDPVIVCKVLHRPFCIPPTQELCSPEARPRLLVPTTGNNPGFLNVATKDH